MSAPDVKVPRSPDHLRSPPSQRLQTELGFERSNVKTDAIAASRKAMLWAILIIRAFLRSLLI